MGGAFFPCRLESDIRAGCDELRLPLQTSKRAGNDVSVVCVGWGGVRGVGGSEGGVKREGGAEGGVEGGVEGGLFWDWFQQKKHWRRQ